MRTSRRPHGVSVSGSRRPPVVAGLARALGSVGFVLVVTLGASAACSSTTSCVDTECAAGNRCLALNGEIKCRKTCSSNVNAAESCPYGYTCTDTATGLPPFCVAIQARTADGKALTRQAGQWGQQCQPNLGEENPACDTAQGFLCYGQSPTDATAYCTRFDCTKDDECGPGFWCGPVNTSPSVTSAKRTTYGEVRNVCLKREYCATCRADLDCLPFDNRPQRCITDASGAGVCAPECDESANCPNEARCADVGAVKADGSPQLMCYPRATVCVGDGSLCSPCRVDTDCGEDGICAGGRYTTERACAKKLPGGCDECPDTLTSPARQIGCTTQPGDEIPKGYCVGIFKIGGTPSDIGCWTPDRR